MPRLLTGASSAGATLPLRTPGALLLATLALTGCSNVPAVDPPSPAAEVAAVCRDLVDSLPDQVEGETAQETDPASDLTAAWGSPPIVLRCGVGEPEAFQPTSQVVAVNGVDWFPEERASSYVFTTWGRTVYVEVTVPDDYAPEVNPLVDLAQAVKDTIPTV